MAQRDWNVTLDRWAYLRMFELNVPFYWCGTRPIMGKRNKGGPYSTSYWVNQEDVLRACKKRVQNFFVYCLTRSKEDPMKFLDAGPQELPGGRRQMWCTGPLCHVAGRQIYQRGPKDFVALRPAEAARAGLADKRVDLYDFAPVAARVKEAPFVLTLLDEPQNAEPNALAFRRLDKNNSYQPIMESVLTNLMASLGRQ
jgi:hypothetical protein